MTDPTSRTNGYIFVRIQGGFHEIRNAVRMCCVHSICVCFNAFCCGCVCVKLVALLVRFLMWLWLRDFLMLL